MASTQLNLLLKTLSVAGIFMSIVLYVVFLVFAMFGLQSGTAWVIMWSSFFVGLPLYGILYATLKVREYLRDILAAIEQKS